MLCESKTSEVHFSDSHVSHVPLRDLDYTFFLLFKQKEGRRNDRQSKYKRLSPFLSGFDGAWEILEPRREAAMMMDHEQEQGLSEGQYWGTRDVNRVFAFCVFHWLRWDSKTSFSVFWSRKIGQRRVRLFYNLQYRTHSLDRVHVDRGQEILHRERLSKGTYTMHVWYVSCSEGMSMSP